jgi:hypothetical protein
MRFPFSMRLLRADAKRNDSWSGTLATLGCVVSVGVFAWVLAMFFWQVAGPLTSTAPLSPDPILKKRIALISAQHPFGIATAGDQAGASSTSDDATGSGGWRLLATIASVDGRGTALLERDGHEVKVLQYGDMLAPGEQVSAIGVNGIELTTPQGKRRMELATFLGEVDGSYTPEKGQASAARGTPVGMPAPRDIVNIPSRIAAPDTTSAQAVRSN